MFKNKIVLITGGTGSFAKAFLSRLLSIKDRPKKIIIFSRDELKQYYMQQKYPPNLFPELRFFIGDIREKDRLKFALKDVDIVVHTAALKQVPAAEYNPFECIKTNIIGSQNIIDCSLETNVSKVFNLSTDKAAAPINLYGATKLCADKLFISANNIRGKRKIFFSVIRYGNVFGSRGSVAPVFYSKRNNKFIEITHKDMTRFNITLDQSVDTVLWSIKNCKGGEIIVPKLPSYKIQTVADAICPNLKHKITGIRPGEKIHEELITSSDGNNAIDFGNYFAILQSFGFNSIDKYRHKLKFKKCSKNFQYISSKNSKFLNKNEIVKLLNIEIAKKNPAFYDSI
mgnify:CR=1 FL=1|tara:strand:- start:60 stop:1085 length:1026 start_codon:yes stop_codon:yes gene_type:complete